MPPKLEDRDDIVYHRCLEKKAYGHAMFKELSAAEMKPGTVGYFNLIGTWVPIIQLTEEEMTEEGTFATNSKLTALRNINKREEKEGPWGPIISDGVHGSSAEVNLAGKAPDGSGGGLKFRYVSSAEESAILVTDGKITHCQLPRETDRLRAWMFTNLTEVLNLSGAVETVKKRGLWIVTETYSAEKAAIALLRSKDSETSFGITASAYGAEVSPSVDWWEGKKETSWKMLEKEAPPAQEGTAETELTSAKEEKFRVVLFMSGIQWLPSTAFLTRGWKEYEDARDQRHLGSKGKPTPIGVEFAPTEPDSNEDPERILFRPYAMGADENLAGLPKPKSKISPFEDVEEEEDSDDEEEEEEDDDGF